MLSSTKLTEHERLIIFDSSTKFMGHYSDQISFYDGEKYTIVTKNIIFP
jgi:hypothetical protein